MGQATADLPDPLAASAGAPNSTDDLLAQLAGEEIERLLAETDNSVEPQPPEPSAPVAVIVPPTPVTPTASPAPAQPVAIVPPAAPPTAAPAEDLESIFTQLDDRDKAAAAVLPKAAMAASAPTLAEEPSMAEALAAEMAEDAAQHARPAGGHASSKAIDTHATQDVHTADTEAKPSLLVALLALMSSPLDAFSDETRDLIGKAAILTMLNALCVLAYVIFFRR